MSKKNQTVGERIKSLREHYKHRGVTVKLTADYLGISPMQLNNYENDKVKYYGYEIIKKMATGFGSTIEWIEHGKGQMLPKGEIDITPILSGEVKAADNPWKDEAFSQLTQRCDKLQQQYDNLMALFNDTVAAFSVKLGKLKAPYLTGQRITKRRLYGAGAHA